MQFEPVTPLLRIPRTNQSIIFHSENGNQSGFLARGHCLSSRSFPSVAVKSCCGRTFSATQKISQHINGKEEKEKQATQWLGWGMSFPSIK